MKSLFYLHWNESELNERIRQLKGLKIKIHSHWSSETTAKWVDELPDVFVISIDRLPSHGRQYAQWLWEAKKRQHIPLIFVDGKPEKIKDTRKKFPKARFCTSKELKDLVLELISDKKTVTT